MEITSDGSSVIAVLGDGDQIIDSEISSAPQSLRTQTEELQEKDSPMKLEPSSFLYLRQDLHTVLEEETVTEEAATDRRPCRRTSGRNQNKVVNYVENNEHIGMCS